MGNYLSCTAPYNQARAWQREEDAETIALWLRGLMGKMFDPAWFTLHRLTGEAYALLASIPTPAPPKSENGSSAFPRETTVAANEIDVPRNPPISQDKLPDIVREALNTPRTMMVHNVMAHFTAHYDLSPKPESR